MTNTVSVTFDPAILPAWARKHQAVIDLCRRDLSYRCNVCSANTAAMRRVLIRQANTHS